VAHSFATSILWAGKIELEEESGACLVDFTPFVVRDAHDSAARMKSAGQGSFSLDSDRSTFDLRATLVFPDNIELEAILTFQASDPGRLVRTVAPTADSVTLTQHHSLIRLPDDDYTPRRFDPRVASFPVSFADYAAPIDGNLTTQWIARHRLKKADPSAARSTVEEPIVYYVDPGAPEPIRSALVEGASWWADAFDAAGFENAFRVEVLPEDAHPLDVRYNVIQWVHRSMRGWSYGSSVTDPRTGEIIKGHVSLGSLRVRQDRMIFEGLAGVQNTGSGNPSDPVQLSLARLRQLSAHEVGHTLGFAHNFAASTYDRASVMDYPAPLVRPTDDGLDLSEAYDVGIGEWDIHCVKYAYSQFPPGADERAELESIIRDAQDHGYLFISDRDARPLGGAHPKAHLWDNGEDAVAALREALQVRRIALDQFGTRNLADGEPLAKLHEVFVPVYLHHRYQLEAAAKSVGGLDYAYSLNTDDAAVPTPLPREIQSNALDAVLACIAPKELDLPDSTVNLMTPESFGFPSGERMSSHMDPAFDPIAAASSAADLALQALLEPARCARLVEIHRRDDSQLSLDEMLDRIISAVFSVPPDEPSRHAFIRRETERLLVTRLIDLAENPRTSPEVRTTVEARLQPLAQAGVPDLQRRQGKDIVQINELGRRITRFIERPHEPATPEPSAPDPPPGSPIGQWPADFLGACSFSDGPF